MLSSAREQGCFDGLEIIIEHSVPYRVHAAKGSTACTFHVDDLPVQFRIPIYQGAAAQINRNVGVTGRSLRQIRLKGLVHHKVYDPNRHRRNADRRNIKKASLGAPPYGVMLSPNIRVSQPQPAPAIRCGPTEIAHLVRNIPIAHVRLPLCDQGNRCRNKRDAPRIGQALEKSPTVRQRLENSLWHRAMMFSAPSSVESWTRDLCIRGASKPC